MDLPTTQDLLNLVSILSAAQTYQYMDKNHAKAVFLQALDRSGYNTPKPEKKVIKEPTKGGE